MTIELIFSKGAKFVRFNFCSCLVFSKVFLFVFWLALLHNFYFGMLNLAPGSPDFLGLWVKLGAPGGSRPRPPDPSCRGRRFAEWSSTFLFPFFLSFCGRVLFPLVSLVSLRRNFYWGKEPTAALPQGGAFLWM